MESLCKILGLNQELSSDEDVPVIRREAQEEIALELYNNALRLQGNSEYEESKDILRKLIDENIPLLENNGGLPKSMSKLKFSSYLNLGDVYMRCEDYSSALDTYLTASDLDGTDITLWFKIGKLSLKLEKFKLAAWAFHKGLECNESHWPSLDSIIPVLYAIQDAIGCLQYIHKALMLDSGYIRGLVIRKQIYLDNPATIDYYKLENRDIKCEPPLDIEIDEELERKYLEEANAIRDRVTELEKSLSTPIPTIALPKPLEEYTWVALAETITHLHQYLVENELCHLTTIDLTKCMSQENEEKLVEVTTEVTGSDSKENCDQVTIKTDESVNEITGDIIVLEEKMEVDPPTILERRISQNSENTNELKMSEGQDGDEEPNTEIKDEDNEETDDKNPRPRNVKRKRDILSELQIWGWHSKRKRPLKAKDLNVEDALNRIVPESLMMKKRNNDDTIAAVEELCDLNFLSVKEINDSVTSYFNTDRERKDVEEFWMTRKVRHVDATDLIGDLVYALSKLWHYKWPKKLIELYVKAYKMFRLHYNIPDVLCGGHSFDFLRHDALATLLYGELFTFSTETAEKLHPMEIAHLRFISGWDEHWKEEFPMVLIRYYWLESHLRRKEEDYEPASHFLEIVKGAVVDSETKTGDKYMLVLPNCLQFGIITKESINKISRYYDVINSLSMIEQLYESEKYDEVAKIIQDSFELGVKPPKVGKIGRPAQLAFLIHSLWYSNRLGECFYWTERCLVEALENYTVPGKEQLFWEKVVEKCLAVLHHIFKVETMTVVNVLGEENRCRLVDSLIKIICRQLNSESNGGIPLGCVTPWILLYYIVLMEEHRIYGKKRMSIGKVPVIEMFEPEPDISPSFAILFSAHEFLGPKRWCLTNDGELLHFIVEAGILRLDTIPEAHKSEIESNLEQAMFCLYQYPSKKNKISRHLVDHNVDPIPLTWDKSFQLYHYYAPEKLPEFNSFKNASISSDLEQLLKRIIALVPCITELHAHLPKITDFMHGKTNTIPEPVEFPNKVRAIYYLIGDFYFKDREFSRSIKYFQLDLCINPIRLDTWACLGLSYAAQLESKLNYCEKLKGETEFLDVAKVAQICFKKALELDPTQLVLWTECGSFEYMVHSFCSRVLKYESENFSMEKFEIMENQKEHYLDSSGKCFEQAIDLYETEEIAAEDQDERWLQYYILGKISEKKKNEPTEYIEYYLKALAMLDENEAVYPDKINYNNPQHLSVEALELNYRIFASILKYLELHENKDIPNSLGAFFKKCLTSSKFLQVNNTRKAVAQNIPAAPVVTAVTAATATTEAGGASTVPLSTTKPIDNSASSTSFQEQFLKALTTKQLDDTLMMELVPNESETQDEVKKCLNELIDKVVMNKEEVDKVVDCETEVKGHADVILISDSEDEDVMHVTEETGSKVDPPKSDNVQDVLDKMMEQTMSESERKQSTESKVEKEKSNFEDSADETDTENVKTSAGDDDEEDDSSSSSSSSSSSGSSDSESDDDTSSKSSSSSSDNKNENLSNSEISQLIDRCINGLELCIKRLGQNYKALYRLTHLYFHYKSKQDQTKCRQLMLSEYKCKDGTVVSGLFSDRKMNNFFNGIWRIPSTELDRPGSLSAHMSRCLSLLLQILRKTNDLPTLLDLYVQLKRTPDPDKIYIKDSERLAFAEQAKTMCLQTLKAESKSLSDMSNPQIVKLLQNIYKAYHRVQKHIPTKENAFATLLTDVYKQFIREKIPETVNILELAVKFCQQNKSSDKHKNQQSAAGQPANLSKGMDVANNNLSNVPVASTAQMPYKRNITNRPRGRPPLPKIPGQIKPPRTRSPSNAAAGLGGSFPWPKSIYESNYAYEYMKHYQEELIKQYSKNMNLTQLTQLTQLLTQGQLGNPIGTPTMPNPFLTQTNLLNSQANFAKQMNLPTPTSSSMTFMDTLNKLTNNMNKTPTGLDKNLMGSMTNAMPPLTPEHLKYLTSMLPQQVPLPKPVTSKQSSNVSVSSKVNKQATSSTSSKAFTTSSGSTNISKYSNSVDIMKLKPGATSPQILKEHTGKSKISYEQIDTATKLMKERPNISITPLTSVIPTTSVTTIANTFGNTSCTVSSRSNLTTSPGKTLQEKLADKKKEQQKKQQKSLESELTKSAAFLKNLNMPKSQSLITAPTITSPIPSNGTVTSSSLHATVLPMHHLNTATMPSFASKSSSSNSFTLEHKLPATLSVTKTTLPSSTIPSPKFPVDSGMTISQVPTPKLEHKHHLSKADSLMGIEISPVFSTTKKSPPIVKTHDKSSKLISPSKILKSKEKNQENVKTDVFNSLKKKSSIYLIPTDDLKENVSESKSDKVEALSIVKKNKGGEKAVRKDSSDDDVICID